MRTRRSNKKLLAICTGLTAFVVTGLLVGTTMMGVGPENPAQSRLHELGNGVDPLTPGLANLLGDVLQPGADWDDLFAADRSFKDVFDEFGSPGANGVPDFLDTYGTLRSRRDAVFVLDDLAPTAATRPPCLARAWWAPARSFQSTTWATCTRTSPSTRTATSLSTPASSGSPQPAPAI